jgi:hypothetical protein
VFFIVGGFVNGRSWSRAIEDSSSWSAWTRRRYQRLLIPLFPLVAFWALLIPILLAAGLPQGAVQLANRASFAPIWFLGVYLLVVAFVPFTWALHRRFQWTGVIGFVTAAVFVDLLARAEMPVVGFANMFFVWAGIHQVGYFWHDMRLPERATVGVWLAAVGIATLLALVTVGGYPVSMVAADEEVRSNVSPPSVALFFLALIQLGIVIAARRPLNRWLKRPRVWGVVVALGSTTLTVYLWHMTAMILVAAFTYLTALWPHRFAIDATWWALRAPWLMLCVLALLLLVFLFNRFEQVVPGRGPAPVRTFTGLITTLAGITWLVQRGLYVPGAPWQISLAVTGVLLVGLASLGALRPLPAPSGRG